MSYKIIITPDAEFQLDESTDYYQKFVSKKVSANFLKEFKKTCQSIKKVKYFQTCFLEFKAVPMKKFPFLIFYTLDETNELIIIKAVFHTSQNPEKYPGS